jgi:hypothetical protein
MSTSMKPMEQECLVESLQFLMGWMNSLLMFVIDYVGTIIITGAVIDFGVVVNGDVSASQQISIEGTGLVKPMFINAPDFFEVSLDDIDFTKLSNLVQTK